MATTGPIIMIDDDLDDLVLYKKAFSSLNVTNEVLTFTCATEALEYLKARIDPCFFVLCDINMPKMDGLQLREELNKDKFTRFKTVPFLFLSTSNQFEHVNKSYNLSIQGYFQKPSEYKNVLQLFKDIISYWSNSLRPKLPV